MVLDGTPTTSALTLSLVPSRTQTGRLLEWAFTAPVGSLNKTARLQVLAATREAFLSREFPPPLQITSIGVGVVAFRLQEHHRHFADVLHTGERFHARGLFRIYSVSHTNFREPHSQLYCRAADVSQNNRPKN